MKLLPELGVGEYLSRCGFPLGRIGTLGAGLFAVLTRLFLVTSYLAPATCCANSAWLRQVSRLRFSFACVLLPLFLASGVLGRDNNICHLLLAGGGSRLDVVWGVPGCPLRVERLRGFRVRRRSVCSAYEGLRRPWSSGDRDDG